MSISKNNQTTENKVYEVEISVADYIEVLQKKLEDLATFFHQRGDYETADSFITDVEVLEKIKKFSKKWNNSLMAKVLKTN